MNTIMPSQEIKRRGMGILDKPLSAGPVHLLKHNRPTYVVMLEEDYQQMLGDLAEARLASSEADLKAGRVRHGTVGELMQELEE